MSELRRLRRLEDKNNRLKRLVADRTVDEHILTETIRKNRRRRHGAAPGRSGCKRRFRSPWRARVGWGFSRAPWYTKSSAKGQSALRMRIRELAMVRPRFGYNRIHTLRRREGWRVNKKRLRRLYRLEGRRVPMRVRRRKHMAVHGGPAPAPSGRHQR